MKIARVEQNFEMWQGNSRDLVFEVEDVEELGQASIKWIASKFGSDEALISKSTNDGIEVNGGQFTVSLEPSDTEDLSPTVYYHEAKVRDEMNNVYTVAVGKMRVLRAELS